MARVDFYVLEEVSADARLRLACRLAEKAFAESQAVFVLASAAEEARLVDDLLWTFRDRSFIPHDLVENAGTNPPPVLIGTSVTQAPDASVLINLAPLVPDGCERFARIVEPLDADEERRKRGRERYRVYRDRGMAPESHTLASPAEP
jgi:DNA polymerase III subunit chi